MDETQERPAPAPARRLYRRRADRKIAGVAAGVADFFGIDPIWVRLAFVLSLLAGGIGLIAYIALWILAPVSDEPSPVPPHDARELASRFASSTLGTVIIVIGALLITTQIFSSRPALFWGLALVALGLFLFWDRDERDPVPGPDPAPGATTATVEPEVPAVAPAGTDEPPPSPSPPVRARPPRRRRPRERSPLGALTLGITLVALGAMWLLNVSTGLDVRLVQYFALALVIIGIGIGVGAWVGRARWLVVPAILLVPLTITASAITVPFEGGFGTRDIRPATLAALQPEYTLAAGSMRIWLLDLPDEVPDEPVTVRASVALGSITVYVPQGMPVDVRTSAGMGTVRLKEMHREGVDLNVGSRFGPVDVPAALTLDLRTSLGGITVWEVDWRPPRRRGT